jgi:hypothetical protein
MNARRNGTDKAKPVTAAIVAAGFGGIAPNLLDLAVLMTGGEKLPNYTYYLGLVLFAAIGCAIGYFWREPDPKRAFYLGVGLPALLQLSANDLSNLRASYAPPDYTVPEYGQGFDSPLTFTSTALAGRQPTETEVAPIYGRRAFFEIDRRFFNETSIRNQLAVLYYYNDEKSPSRVPVALLSTFIRAQTAEGKTPNRTFLLQMDVPETARAFRIQIENEYSEALPLPKTPHSAIVYRLGYVANTWSGFKQAVGRRSASRFGIDLRRNRDAQIGFDNYAELVKRDDKYNWYKWTTFVDADETQLKRITTVDYKLHKTFSEQPPETNRSAKFAISRVGWGSFWIHAVVSYADGKETNVQYYLDLRKRQVRELPSPQG